MRLINNSGLRSEKNLCYVNSALQLINNIPRLKSFFVERQFRLVGEEKRTMKIANELARLLSSGESSLCSAAELRRLVGTSSRKPHFIDGTQQDISEFLLTLLQEVEKEISELSWEAKIVLQEFVGKEQTKKKYLNNIDGTCGKCKKLPRVEEENFNLLQINIPDTAIVLPLSRLVSGHFQESSNIFQMSCSNCCPHSSNCPKTGACKQKEVVSQKFLLKGPDILIIQVNRFSDNLQRKIKTTIWPDDILQMNTGEEYELNSIATTSEFIPSYLLDLLHSLQPMSGKT